jgi:crotonobetainyl-CoA:carnitine CoA-transferase CaiB-like acyl-CoA transferase
MNTGDSTSADAKHPASGNPRSDTGFAPLKGIRILDLTKVLAGPLCTQYLADLGASVVKVEPCDGGDDTRSWPPHMGNDGAIFLNSNRNKQSLALDLKSEAGREVVWRLIERSDVLVESYRKGAMDRLGLDYDSVKKRNPRLIYASISGFGRTGPLSGLPGYDVMMQAFSGIMGFTGEKDGGPVRSPFSPLDQTTGIWAAFGILSALRHRDATGEGKYLEVSLYETAMAFQGPNAQAYWTNGRPPQPCGSGHEYLCPYQAFKASDRYILVAVGNDKLWRQLCAVADLNEYVDDPRFRTNSQRVAHFAETVELVGSRIRQKTVAEWADILTAAGVPNSPINTLDDVLDMPHTAERGVIMDYEHPAYGPLKAVAMPVRFDGVNREVRSAPPMLGQHSASVLRELGFRDDEIERMKKAVVILDKPIEP